MFKGQHAHTLDAKGRAALPAPFKRDLAERGDDLLVVTLDLEDPCLVAWPHSEWTVFERRLADLSMVDPAVRQVRRYLAGRAHECPVDKVGRVNLPAVLRKAVGIDKELVWQGQLKCIELWDPARLDAVVPMRAEAPVSPATLAKAAELGL